MKILTVCDQGNSRSVQLAYPLKYKYKADVIPIGLDTTSKETLKMLFDWADHIILTDKEQFVKIPEGYDSKIKVWDFGDDRYIRPLNAEFAEYAKRFIEENPL